MNEQEIFTADEFRAQAAELRAAVAELQRRDAQRMIDPYDPFENETEFRHYNQNYSTIVPQIQLPGCQIPIRPNARERRHIRHYYNITGTIMLGHMFLSNILALIFMLLYYAVQTLMDASKVGGELPANYETLLEEVFAVSSANTAMNVIIFLICNALFAIVGCKWAKIPIPELFHTKGLSIGLMLMYMCIAIALQSGCGYLSSWITELLSQAGVTAYEPDFSTGQELKNVVLMSIYSCIVAPVTEELLFRGFALKTLSRVSQRFGIVVSALLFGLWHENIAQFVLAFFVGILMGYLTVKHNSIMPAIICHMTVNTASQLFDIAYTYQWYGMYMIMDYLYLGITVVGAVLLIRMLLRERLPYTVPHQAERGFRIAVTSIPLVLVILLHFANSIAWIMQSSAG